MTSVGTAADCRPCRSGLNSVECSDSPGEAGYRSIPWSWRIGDLRHSFRVYRGFFLWKQIPTRYNAVVTMNLLYACDEVLLNEPLMNKIFENHSAKEKEEYWQAAEDWKRSIMWTRDNVPETEWPPEYF